MRKRLINISSSCLRQFGSRYAGQKYAIKPTHQKQADTTNLMKKLTKFTLLLWTALIILCCARVQAGLQIPYTPDANTLHLWHFNDSTNQVNGFNTVTDAVNVDSITLTNFGQSASGNAPFTNIFLVTNGATAALKDCLSILPDNGNPAPGPSDAFCGLGNTITNSFPDTTEFRNPNSGAFTFEL
jgi:hypothetical protein